MSAVIAFPRRSAEVVPFPVARRKGRIAKTAAYMAGLSQNHAEAHLREQIRRLRSNLERNGIAAPVIAGEAASYEAAVRAALWRAILSPGGAA